MKRKRIRIRGKVERESVQPHATGARLRNAVKRIVPDAVKRKLGPAVDNAAAEPSPHSGLLPHQSRVVERLRAVSGLVVAHGLGTGKTRTALAAQADSGKPADVVAPAALVEHWRKEIVKWKNQHGRVHLHSQQQAARAGFVGVAPLTIVDEGHRARNAGTKLAAELRAAPGGKRMLLTGTPMYNRPSDVAPLVNWAAGKKVLPEGAAFERRHLAPGIIDRLRGRQLSHVKELVKAFAAHVDFHGGREGDTPPVHERRVNVPMGPHQSQLYQAAIGAIPWEVRKHLHKGNVDEKAIARLRPYLTGPRMLSNTTAAVRSSIIEQPKIDRAFADLKDHLRSAEGKALVYSNWIEGGIAPMRRKLEEAHIPHGVFTGDPDHKKRAAAVQAYNEGKTRVLLVSSSGGEGLDLKGTRLVQVLEPHFNRAKIEQVIGRASRIGSHDHLPPEQRNVEVVHYLAQPRSSLLGTAQHGVDNWLTDLSEKKDKLHRELKVLMAKATAQYRKP